MSHTYVKNHLHLVFSTKDRQKLIPKEIQPELWVLYGRYLPEP